MRLEATKFRPREVVKHVLQTAAASLQKILTLEGHITDDVPVEVRALLYLITDINYLPLKPAHFLCSAYPIGQLIFLG